MSILVELQKCLTSMTMLKPDDVIKMLGGFDYSFIVFWKILHSKDLIGSELMELFRVHPPDYLMSKNISLVRTNTTSVYL